MASNRPHLHAQHHATAAGPSALPPVRPRNDIDLNRERLITILTYFSQLLETTFDRRPFRLVAHGGECILLHPRLYELSRQQHRFLPDLPHRTTTRNVNYIHRSFTIEMAQVQVLNAAGKLKECILTTARYFNLGADWMNSDAEVALPMATAPNGVNYDPIYHASVQPANIELHTIFRSPNGMLTLISVTPFWAVSLKLVRYSPQDAADISLLLRNGTTLSNTKWTVETLREWLFANCWAMGYAQYDVTRFRKLNERLEHAIQMVAQWEGNEAANPSSSLAESAWSSVNVAFTPPSDRRVSPLAAMGGGEVVGGEHGRDGWKPAWPRGVLGFIQGGRHPQGSGLNSTPHGTPPEGPFIQSDEKSDNKFVVPPMPHFSDPADFTVARHTQDIVAAAARKARKKAMARKSLSSTQSLPPPSYNTWMGYLVPPHLSLGFYSGQAPDQHGPGLSSLQSLSQNPHPSQVVPGMYNYARLTPTSLAQPLPSASHAAGEDEESRKLQSAAHAAREDEGPRKQVRWPQSQTATKASTPAARVPKGILRQADVSRYNLAQDGHRENQFPSYIPSNPATQGPTDSLFTSTTAFATQQTTTTTTTTTTTSVSAHASSSTAALISPSSSVNSSLSYDADADSSLNPSSPRFEEFFSPPSYGDATPPLLSLLSEYEYDSPAPSISNDQNWGLHGTPGDSSTWADGRAENRNSAPEAAGQASQHAGVQPDATATDGGLLFQGSTGNVTHIAHSISQSTSELLQAVNAPSGGPYSRTSNHVLTISPTHYASSASASAVAATASSSLGTSTSTPTSADTGPNSAPLSATTTNTRSTSALSLFEGANQFGMHDSQLHVAQRDVQIVNVYNINVHQVQATTTTTGAMSVGHGNGETGQR